MFVYMHVDTRSRELIRMCVCACKSEDGGCVEWSGCISIQSLLPMRSVWEVEKREDGICGGRGSPSSEQNSAMGWNKAARRGAA